MLETREEKETEFNTCVGIDKRKFKRQATPQKRKAE